MRFTANVNKRKATGGNPPMAKRLKKLERQVAINKGELKYVEFTISNEELQVDYNFELMGSILQGVGKDERIGNAIRVKRIETYTNGVSEDCRLRLMLYSPNDTGETVSTNTNTPYNRFVKTDRFRVWKDSKMFKPLYNLTGANTPIFGGQMQSCNKTWAMPMKVVYKDDGDVSHNSVVLNALRETATGTRTAAGPAGDLDNPNLRINGKIWYYDM